MKLLIVLPILVLISYTVLAQKPRARDIGIPFSGTPGKYNAITDVKGVEVGYNAWSSVLAGNRLN